MASTRPMALLPLVATRAGSAPALPLPDIFSSAWMPLCTVVCTQQCIAVEPNGEGSGQAQRRTRSGCWLACAGCTPRQRLRNQGVMQRADVVHSSFCRLCWATRRQHSARLHFSTGRDAHLVCGARPQRAVDEVRVWVAPLVHATAATRASASASVRREGGSCVRVRT